MKEINGLEVGVNAIILKDSAIHMPHSLVEMAVKSGYHVDVSEIEGNVYVTVYRSPFKIKQVSEGYSELWSGNSLYHRVGHKITTQGWVKI